MVATTGKDRKPFIFDFVAISMAEEIRILPLHLKELQLREKFGGILD